MAQRDAALGPDPSKNEVGVLNRRVNALWNNTFDDARRQVSVERWPSNFLEINPADAATRRWRGSTRSFPPPTWVDRGAGYVIRVAGDRSASVLPASTIAALAASSERTVSVVGSRLGAADGLTVAGS